jgi:hypothetical protein
MATQPSSRLSAELATYESHKGEWLLAHRNEFVVMKGDRLLGFFPEFQEAYTVGVKEFGTDADFLVKRVTEHEPVCVVY